MKKACDRKNIMYKFSLYIKFNSEYIVKIFFDACSVC
jgi:hypothetical protein